MMQQILISVQLIGSQNDRLTESLNKLNKHPKQQQQQRVSIGPTTIAKKSTSLTSEISKSSFTTTTTNNS